MHLCIADLLLSCLYVMPASCLSDAPLLLVVSLDGFWYKYLTLYNTPNLNALASSGVRAEYMENVYVTKTYPNHFSIATGYYEESHGVVGNEMYDPVLNETFEITNTETKWWDNGRVVPIWVANQVNSTSRRSGAMMWPGSDVRIHGGLSFYVEKYDPSVSFVSRVETVISWFLETENPANCIFFYYEEPDSTGHSFGPFSPEVKARVEEVDKLIGYMVHRLKSVGIFDKLNMIVLSDHGMAPVPGKNAIKMDDILDPRTYVRGGTSPVWNLLPVKGKEGEVLDKLRQAANHSHFKVFTAKEMPASYHYGGNPRALSIVVEADEGWELVGAVSSMEVDRTYGDHGYNNSLDSMHPLFIAHGPSFKSNHVSRPFPNVDLYPLMCYLLQIPVLPSNGSLDRAIYHLRLGQDHEEHVAPRWLLGVTVILAVAVTVLLVMTVRLVRRTKELERTLREGDYGCALTSRRGDITERECGTGEENKELLLEEVVADT